MMRLSGKEITPATRDAIAAISRFIATLAKNFHLDEADKLFPQESQNAQI